MAKGGKECRFQPGKASERKVEKVYSQGSWREFCSGNIADKGETPWRSVESIVTQQGAEAPLAAPKAQDWKRWHCKNTGNNKKQDCVTPQKEQVKGNVWLTQSE